MACIQPGWPVWTIQQHEQKHTAPPKFSHDAGSVSLNVCPTTVCGHVCSTHIMFYFTFKLLKQTPGKTGFKLLHTLSFLVPFSSLRARVSEPNSWLQFSQENLSRAAQEEHTTMNLRFGRMSQTLFKTRSNVMPLHPHFWQIIAVNINGQTCAFIRIIHP